MAKRIVYIHPGDMIEVRLCDPHYEARATEWAFRTASLQSMWTTTVRFDEDGALEVFDPMLPVFEGTGTARRQLLVKA